jgi:hypothetical protein
LLSFFESFFAVVFDVFAAFVVGFLTVLVWTAFLVWG